MSMHLDIPFIQIIPFDLSAKIRMWTGFFYTCIYYLILILVSFLHESNLFIKGMPHFSTSKAQWQPMAVVETFDG